MNGWAGLSKQGCKTLAKLLLAAVIMAANGCEDDGGGGLGSDVGDNDPGVVVALGDSITAPWRGNMPWPVLTGIDTGKAVDNVDRIVIACADAIPEAKASINAPLHA